MLILLKVFALAILTSLIVTMNACGGGKGDNTSSQPESPPTQYLGGVHFGYFITVTNQIEETIDHVDLYMLPKSGYGDDITTDLDQLRRGNAKAILVVEKFMYSGNHCAFDDTGFRIFLNRIKQHGQLDLITGFYPKDEPDLVLGEAEIRTCNNRLRELIKEYPELTGSVLCVIYSDHGYPAIDTYDWIGHDAYPGLEYNVPITSTQRIILVPGGANPWQTPSNDAVNYAKTHASVAWVLAFLYADYTTQGIRNNGLRKNYCEGGKQLTLKTTGVCQQ